MVEWFGVAVAMDTSFLHGDLVNRRWSVLGHFFQIWLA